LHDYQRALSKHFNIPQLNLGAVSPQAGIQKAIGEAYAEKNKIVVVENTPSRVKLALADPDPFVMDELRRFFPPGKAVEFYLASPEEVAACRKRKFDPFVANNYR
ncbi:MAG TPA: hypothetical protein VLS90_12600, partial [Thermodesulfobacteriota bacterium]|nr:hypothetical protein [Thermodesulfobacteriota bacterium]